MKRAVVLSLTTLFGACSLPLPLPGDVASSNLKREMDKWVGRPVDELVVAKGAPTETYLLEAGGRVYEYARKQQVKSTPSTGILPTGGDVVVPAGGGATIVIPGATEPVRSRNKAQVPKTPCELQFIVSASNIIESWATEGDCN